MITTPVCCVVDASVGVKLVVTEVLSAEAHALFAHLAHDPASRFWAPDLFDIECANILWKHVIRFGLSVADAELHLAALNALSIQRLTVSTLAGEALKIAAQFRISAYDACYVAASQRLGVPLITADSKLAAAVSGAGYHVLDLAGLAIPAVPP